MSEIHEIREQARDVADLLKVLGNENRLLILCELTKGPASVSALLEQLKITQSGLSQHLSLLKSYGILDYDRRAQMIFYKIKDNRVLKIMQVLKDTYCNTEEEQDGPI